MANASPHTEEAPAVPPASELVVEETLEYEIASTESDATGWLADLEAISDVLESPEPENAESFAGVAESDQPAPVLVDETIAEPEFDDFTEQGIDVEKNGSGLIEPSATAPSIEPNAADAERVYSQPSEAQEVFTATEIGDDPDDSAEEKSSPPWPEIIVVGLILIALIMSFAVVWVVATR